MARPRQDLEVVTIKVPPEVREALRAFAEAQQLTVSEAGRKLLRVALEGEGANLVARDLADEGYQDGRRQGLRAFHEALADLTNKFKDEK